MVVRGVGGPEPIKPNRHTERVEKSKTDFTIGNDEVSISEDAKVILQNKQVRENAINIVKNTPDIRPSAVERGKKFIESGEYKSDKAIDFVAKRISDEIVASLFIRKEDEI